MNNSLCIPAHLRLLALGLLAAALVGCVSSVNKVQGWLSSNADALAVIDGRILHGEVNFAHEREGSVHVQTTQGAELNCSGQLRYTATNSGVINLFCDNKHQFTLVFQELSAVSGAAGTRPGEPNAALTYGLKPDKAAGFLGVPVEELEGKKK